ncbi:MAG TPA: O-methyltransferase [Bacteroidales bacterium]|nr:O-methyltransferase [Bacteroidales bacterium]
MFEFSPELEEYLTSHIDQEDSVLSELNRETHLKMLHPRMLSGHLQGKILTLFSKILQPETILEVGTYTGYSAICLARGLKPGGKLHTIDINDELADFSSAFFKKAGLEKSIILHSGNALKIIPEMDETFDLVFLDGEKSEYSQYYDLVFDKVKTGGLIIADNVLWDGKVLKAPQPNDLSTKGIIEFNNRIAKDNRIEKVIFPVRDGFSIIRKKNNNAG